MIFEITSKYPIVILRLVFGKVGLLAELPGHDSKLASDVYMI